MHGETPSVSRSRLEQSLGVALSRGQGFVAGFVDGDLLVEPGALEQPTGDTSPCRYHRQGLVLVFDDPCMAAGERAEARYYR
jgi:hypothetical protein